MDNKSRTERKVCKKLVTNSNFGHTLQIAANNGAKTCVTDMQILCETFPGEKLVLQRIEISNGRAPKLKEDDEEEGNLSTPRV